MLARNCLAVAAAGGLALGTLTGLIWHPRMKMAAGRPWQVSGRLPDLRDFQDSRVTRDFVPVAVSPYRSASWTKLNAPMPRVALAVDVEPQRPVLDDEPRPDAEDAARHPPADDAIVAQSSMDEPAAPLPEVAVSH